MGIALVYVAARIAPANRRRVAVGVAALGVVISLLGVISNLALDDWSRAWQAVTSLFVTGTLCWKAWRDDRDFADFWAGAEN